ncbi:membrane-bound lytic murein transglycosylase D [Formivibrio citricus]|uniref:Membrane-bound lytic murein transglycosylase D n=1 Tax=Formivibrio citricus TaxID=83765 RepID=A0A1I4YL32_9NEIS|nr:LysM peptidoglycan-binding domain-containing protein [Formivibrio citricus]SFN38483.1 membrane-bound lytic murein transglycosylase D [Formivibrio citricus]
MKYRLLAGLLATLCASAFASEQAAGISISRLDYQLSSTALTFKEPSKPTPEEVASLSSTLFTEAQDQAEEKQTLNIADAAKHPDLWSRIRTGFRMPDLDSPTVRKWEQYYANRPDYLNRIIERGSRYLYHVVEEVEKRGMPMEIALLPMIESAYNPKAESSARASGMWQFIPETGKRYGLERTWWYDGRRDVVAATSAALDYLTEIHGMFGDWQLALASYNWGENAVARAVAKNQNAGLSTTYSDLRMPVETANYVPKLMAVRNIIANPSAYGIEIADVPNKPYFKAIENNRHMDVRVAAQLAEIPVAELLRLNPGFMRPVIAQKDERKLVLPADKVETFQTNLAKYDKPLLNWQPYVTRKGEDLSRLAGQFGISLAELKNVNDIPAKARVAAGQTILVPKVEHLDVSDRQTLAALASNRLADPVDRGENDQPSAAKNFTQHRVARGETAFSIAKRYHISVAQLRAMNGKKNNRVAVGETLRIAAAPAQTRKQYVAKRGDTVAAVAKRFNVAAVDLMKWNNLEHANLQPGSRIVIH